MDFSALIDWIKETMEDILPFQIIDDYEKGVRLRTGKYRGTLDAGLRWKIPFFDSIPTQSIATTTMTVDPQSVTSKDDKNIVVSCMIKYKVTNVRRFLIEVEDAVDALSDTTMGVVFDTISDLSWEDIKDSDLSAMITEEVKGLSLEWGISVKKVTIVDLAEIKSIRLIGGGTLVEDE